MIIFRYLAREVFNAFIVISIILLLIFLSNQFAHYLSMTAAGKLFGMQLLHLMFLEIPQLLCLIFPLALYLSILLSYGRMYVDNEMVVLTACGLSQRKLLGITLALSTFVVIPVILFTFWINPIVANNRNQLLDRIYSASILQSIMPGRFMQANNGQRIIYVESMSRDRQQLKNVFGAEQSSLKNSKVGDLWTVMSAAGGHHYVDPKTKDHFVVADNGYRYEGVPGTKNFTIYQFSQYGIRIDTPISYTNHNTDSMSTSQLWHLSRQHHLDANAELQWRLSLPVCIFILAFLAFSLSRVAPRHGRFAKFFPAILLYIVYANFIIVGQNWISEGKLSPWFGLWVLHCFMITIGFLLYAQQAGLLRRWRLRIKQ